MKLQKHKPSTEEQINQKHSLVLGDSLEKLKEIPSNSIDSIVTDPPYELGFMGKKWDSSGIAYNVELWKECLRVLKPGGHLLAFGGTRTYHRMTCAIEDAGFEIRDCIQWIYGQGFPKSHNIAKAINKAAGVEFKEVAATGVGFMNSENDGYNNTIHQLEQTGNSTEEAEQWGGWGTALKPANEPIVVARKPLSEKTIAANVLMYGTGAINVDASRVGGPHLRSDEGSGRGIDDKNEKVYGKGIGGIVSKGNEAGRWPANILFDEETAKILDKQSGNRPGMASQNDLVETPSEYFGANKKPGHREGYNDNGGASRFFYVAKPSVKEREAGLENFNGTFSPTMGNGIGGKEHDPQTARKKKNIHPTVKPIALMSWLVKLVTPPDGTVLDPFMGSGTTGIAAIQEGFFFIGIEMDKSYIDIANARINYYNQETDENKQ